MRVAMLGLRAPREGLGGVEGVVKALAPLLTRRGVDLTVLCRSRYLEGPSPPGIHEVGFPSLPGSGVETLSYALLAMLATRPFDVVHIHSHGSSALSVLPHLRHQVVVVSFHGLDWSRPKWGGGARTFLRLSEEVALRYADRVVVVSPELEQIYRGRARGGVELIPNGVEPQPTIGPGPLQQLGLEPEGYVLFLGRLVPDKGCHVLLDTWRGMSHPLKLVMAGPGEENDPYVRDLHTRAAADPRVIMAGPVTGDLKLSLLQHAAAFVLPSRVEGLSLALLEAMMAGCCVIASDIPANRGVLEGAGILVPEGDQRALTLALEKALGDRPAARILGELAHQRAVAHYSWDHAADLHADLYRRLVACRGRGGVL